MDVDGEIQKPLATGVRAGHLPVPVVPERLEVDLAGVVARRPHADLAPTGVTGVLHVPEPRSPPVGPGAGSSGRGGILEGMSVHPVLLVDLDGTVTDSLPGIAASLHHALEAVGARWDDSRDIRSIAGPPMPETLASLGLDEATCVRAMQAYRERYDALGWAENAVFPGVEDLLRRLHGQGYRMALATSKDERAARRIVRHFGLDGYFGFLGGADPAVGRSAKADVVAYSLEALGLTPVPATAGGTAEVLMIGDRAHDVEGAARYGIPCVLVEWGYGSPNEKDTARWSAADPAELERIVHEW